LSIDSLDDLIVRPPLEQDSAKQVALWKEAQLELLRKMVSYPVIAIGYSFARSPKMDYGYEMVKITDGPNPTEMTPLLK